MKKILGLLLIAIFAITYSCSSDKDYKSDIVGKWSYLRMMPGEVVTTDAEVTKEIKKELAYEEDAEDNLALEFMHNGKGLIHEKTSYENDIETTAFLYTIDGDNLTVKILIPDEDPEIENYKIDHIKSKKMTLVLDQTEDYKDYYENNYPTGVKVTKVTAILEYKKID